MGVIGVIGVIGTCGLKKGYESYLQNGWFTKKNKKHVGLFVYSTFYLRAKAVWVLLDQKRSDS